MYCKHCYVLCWSSSAFNLSWSSCALEWPKWKWWWSATIVICYVNWSSSAFKWAKWEFTKLHCNHSDVFCFSSALMGQLAMKLMMLCNLFICFCSSSSALKWANSSDWWCSLLYVLWVFLCIKVGKVRLKWAKWGLTKLLCNHSYVFCWSSAFLWEQWHSWCMATIVLCSVYGKIQVKLMMFIVMCSVGLSLHEIGESEISWSCFATILMCSVGLLLHHCINNGIASSALKWQNWTFTKAQLHIAPSLVLLPCRSGDEDVAMVPSTHALSTSTRFGPINMHENP